MYHVPLRTGRRTHEVLRLSPAPGCCPDWWIIKTGCTDHTVMGAVAAKCDISSYSALPQGQGLLHMGDPYSILVPLKKSSLNCPYCSLKAQYLHTLALRLLPTPPCSSLQSDSVLKIYSPASGGGGRRTRSGASLSSVSPYLKKQKPNINPLPSA